MKPANHHVRPLLLLMALSMASPLVANSALAQSDAPGEEPYPNLDLHILDTEEQALFVQVAQGQACPCDGLAGTLAECLADPTNRCQVAELAASHLMRRIKEDTDATQLTADLEAWVQAALTPIPFNLADAPRLGPEDAPVQIVVFSDFECPFCRRFSSFLETIHEEFGDQVAIFFKHLPIESHPHSAILARATMAAHLQGQFWPAHNLFFQQQETLYAAEDIQAAIIQLASTLSLDMERFTADLSDPALDRIPDTDREEARVVGVRATPTCFINGIEFREISNIDRMRAQIQRLLQAE